MQIANQKARTSMETWPQRPPEAASARPPETKPGHDHCDRPSVAKFEQPASGLAEGPAAMKRTRDAGKPLGRGERTQHAGIVWIDEYGVRQTAGVAQQDDRAAMR